ncbi:hypothetical protein N7468_002151 [Penicillium chermesinum]|uniref:Uncharacterized protein n=1 Tax=Penicillium chermesinum TaxID=63820 RepID=A0A9W9PK39_9EURO|nr:uncharacterized protein N7468_002151 [Penicillium chermesinum]KAJ5247168.1 hypothetical protein N7468_002151 [Penicillium chermesinum]
MRASIFFATLSAFAISGAIAQDSSSAAADTSVPPNPETQYLTETNSLGVPTGQPSVITSQPAVVTSQPAVVTSQTAAASIPAGLTAPVVTPVTNSGSTTLVTGTRPASSSSTADSSSSTETDSSSTSSTALPPAPTALPTVPPMATAGMGLAAGAALLAFL